MVKKMKFERKERPQNIRNFPTEIDHEPIPWLGGVTHYRILREDMKACFGTPTNCEHFCYGSCKIPRCKFKPPIKEPKVIEFENTNS